MDLNYTERSAYNFLIPARLNTKAIKINLMFLINFIFFLITFNVFPVNAQPSGGPLRTISQTYEIPKAAGKIFT